MYVQVVPPVNYRKDERMSHCIERDLKDFLESGVCIAREPNTGKIRAIFAHNCRFKIPEIHKILFGDEIEYHIKIHKD